MTTSLNQYTQILEQQYIQTVMEGQRVNSIRSGLGLSQALQTYLQGTMQAISLSNNVKTKDIMSLVVTASASLESCFTQFDDIQSLRIVQDITNDAQNVLILALKVQQLLFQRAADNNQMLQLLGLQAKNFMEMAKNNHQIAVDQGNELQSIQYANQIFRLYNIVQALFQPNTGEDCCLIEECKLIAQDLILRGFVQPQDGFSTQISTSLREQQEMLQEKIKELEQLHLQRDSGALSEPEKDEIDSQILMQREAVIEHVNYLLVSTSEWLKHQNLEDERTFLSVIEPLQICITLCNMIIKTHIYRSTFGIETVIQSFKELDRMFQEISGNLYDPQTCSLLSVIRKKLEIEITLTRDFGPLVGIPMTSDADEEVIKEIEEAVEAVWHNARLIQQGFLQLLEEVTVQAPTFSVSQDPVYNQQLRVNIWQRLQEVLVVLTNGGQAPTDEPDKTLYEHTTALASSIYHPQADEQMLAIPLSLEIIDHIGNLVKFVNEKWVPAQALAARNTEGQIRQEHASQISVFSLLAKMEAIREQHFPVAAPIIDPAELLAAQMAKV